MGADLLGQRLDGVFLIGFSKDVKPIDILSLLWHCGLSPHTYTKGDPNESGTSNRKPSPRIPPRP